MDERRISAGEAIDLLDKRRGGLSAQRADCPNERRDLPGGMIEVVDRLVASRIAGRREDQRDDARVLHDHADASCELIDKILVVGVVIHAGDHSSGSA